MDFDDFDDIATPPILYYDVISSHARSCQMLTKILNINVDLKLTDSLDDIDLDETYIWINSFCKLPTLVDCGKTLCNGHSILIYLCQKYDCDNSANLCPRDYISRQKITSVLFYEGCILHRCFNHLMTDIILARYPNFNVEHHKEKVLNVYNSLNSFLNGHLYMIGNFLTIADISIVSSVSALSIIFPINHNKFPKLFDWFERIRKMEFYNCNNEGILKLRYMLRNIGKFPLPSQLGNEMKRNSNRCERNSENEHKKSKMKRLENINQRSKNHRTDSIENAAGLPTNNKNSQECYCSESKNKAIVYDSLSHDSTETSQIYKSPKAVVHSSSAEENFKDSSHHPANKINEGLEQLVRTCSCSKELGKRKESEMAKRCLNRSQKCYRQRPIVSDKNKKEIDLNTGELKGNDGSTTSAGEDTNCDYYKTWSRKEISDKALKNNNGISAAVSATRSSSIDSNKNTFPLKCGRSQHCLNKPKVSGEVCRRGARIEALHFDEVTQVVMPNFLVRNFDTPECSDKSDIKNNDRLEAGSNRNHHQNHLIVMDFPHECDKLKFIGECRENSGSHAGTGVVYFLCEKNICRNKNKCGCDGCCKKKKVVNSKIPRLIPHFHPLFGKGNKQILNL